MDLKAREWVLLKFKKTRLCELKGKEKIYIKLSPWYYGPFKVLEEINEVAFKLELPKHWRIHNAFHINLLKKYPRTRFHRASSGRPVRGGRVGGDTPTKTDCVPCCT